MNGNQAIGPPTPGTLTELAVSAARAAREEDESQRVAQGKDITSLNRLLQWGAANAERAAEDTAEASAGTETMRARTVEELKRDREWLDAAFPDMFAEVRRLSAVLAGKHPPGTTEEERQKPPVELDDDMRVDILNEIEEYMADLNYATNIAKLGTLAPVLEHAAHPTPRVRAAAFWVLGTSMQDVDDVKKQILDAGGVPILVAGLADNVALPRSKACMAVSSLLKHASQSVIVAFRDAGGPLVLEAALTDEDLTVRRRALFFLQHCRTSGNDWFVDAVLRSEVVTCKIADLLARADHDDCAAIEYAAGALEALAKHDRMRVLELAPSLLGIVERHAGAVEENDTRQLLKDLSDALSPSFP